MEAALRTAWAPRTLGNRNFSIKVSASRLPKPTSQTRKLRPGVGSPNYRAEPGTRPLPAPSWLLGLVGVHPGTARPKVISPFRADARSRVWGGDRQRREGRVVGRLAHPTVSPMGQGQGHWVLAWVDSQRLPWEGHSPGAKGGWARGGALMSN